MLVCTFRGPAHCPLATAHLQCRRCGTSYHSTVPCCCCQWRTCRRHSHEGVKDVELLSRLSVGESFALDAGDFLPADPHLLVVSLRSAQSFVGRTHSGIPGRTVLGMLPGMSSSCEVSSASGSMVGRVDEIINECGVGEMVRKLEKEGG